METKESKTSSESEESDEVLSSIESLYISERIWELFSIPFDFNGQTEHVQLYALHNQFCQMAPEQVIWKGAHVLVNFIKEHITEYYTLPVKESTEITLVELGSGPGLAGLASWQLVNASNVFISFLIYLL